METKIFITFLLIISLYKGANSQAPNNSGASGVTQNYIPDNLLNQTIAGGLSAIAQNCGTGSPDSSPLGMFQYDGDLESFAAASRGTDGQCVGTNYNSLHRMAPFQDNTCLRSAWKVSHGTPEVGVNNGNHFMHIWSGNWTNDNDFEGEGLFYDCAFLQCTNYNISLKLSSTSTISKVYFYIASGLQHKAKDGFEWSPESSFYKVPAVTKAYLIHSITNFNSGAGNWITITLPTITPPDPGMKLWIYTEDDRTDIFYSAGLGADLLFIDEVTDGLPGSSSTCAGIINYSEDSGGIFNPSGSNMPFFTKAYTITASVNPKRAATEFVAGESITLSPGFSTNPGSFFYAHIIPCTFGNICSTAYTVPAFDDLKEETSVENITQFDGQDSYRLNVYPNPSKGEFNIDKPVNEKFISLKLIEESTGREVGFSNYEDLDNSIKFRVNTSSNGIFILLLKTEKKSYSTKIFID